LIIGVDITIAYNANTSTFNILDNAISSVTAYADKYLQKIECKKYMHNHKPNINDPTSNINSNQVIGDLLQQTVVLLSFAIDPHGHWGSILKTTSLYNHQAICNTLVQQRSQTQEQCLFDQLHHPAQ
jgi:hypothetical protein